MSISSSPTVKLSHNFEIFVGQKLKVKPPKCLVTVLLAFTFEDQPDEEVFESGLQSSSLLESQ